MEFVHCAADGEAQVHDVIHGLAALGILEPGRGLQHLKQAGQLRSGCRHFLGERVLNVGHEEDLAIERSLQAAAYGGAERLFQRANRVIQRLPDMILPFPGARDVVTLDLVQVGEHDR